MPPSVAPAVAQPTARLSAQFRGHGDPHTTRIPPTPGTGETPACRIGLNSVEPDASPLLPPHYTLVRHARVDSVVEEAARLARAGAEEGTLVWADEQTDARTRSSAPWFSPPGNLHCALVLRPDYDNARSGQLAYVAAVAAGSALAEVLAPMTGLRYRWPGDLLINDLDAGRIELAASGGDAYAWLVIALMINVAMHPPNPEPERYNSVHASGAAEVTVARLLEDFSRYFLHWINRWADEGLEPVARQWRIRAESIGEPVTLHVGGGEANGTLVGIDPQGNLILSERSGGERRISVNAYFGLDAA